MLISHDGSLSIDLRMLLKNMPASSVGNSIHAMVYGTVMVDGQTFRVSLPVE